MTDHDSALMGRIRRMWQHADPMPTDLPDRVIAALWMDDFEVELLTLTPVEAVAVRGEEAQVLECSTDDLHLVLRISTAPDGARRLDGWSEGLQEVELLRESGSRVAPVSEAGRFEFSDLTPGAIRLRLRSVDRGFLTTDFEV